MCWVQGNCEGLRFRALFILLASGEYHLRRRRVSRIMVWIYRARFNGINFTPSSSEAGGKSQVGCPSRRGRAIPSGGTVADQDWRRVNKPLRI